jgi:hypothetical protein
MSLPDNEANELYKVLMGGVDGFHVLAGVVSFFILAVEQTAEALRF